MKNLILLVVGAFSILLTDAQIIYTDLVPDHHYTSGNHSIDINNDGIDDFTFIMTSETGPVCPNCNSSPHTSSSISIKPLGFSEVGTYDGSSKLDSGIWINASTLNWSQSTVIMSQVTWDGTCHNVHGYHYCSTIEQIYGDWMNIVYNKYLGVSITIDSLKYYGWVRLDVDSSLSFTIKDYAFNSVPYQSIIAGDITEPDGCPPFDITISNQNQVDHFSDTYPVCTAIAGSLNIHGSNITNINGLGALNSIGGSLTIEHNPALGDLTGLNSLNIVGDSIKIIYNQALTDLTGLDNVNTDFLKYLSIKFNSSLSTCDVQSVCDYLAAGDGIIDIHDNAVGCNGQQQVEAACEALGVENLALKKVCSIFPNPSSGQFNIDLTLAEKTNVNFIVLNSLGQEVAILIDETQEAGFHHLSWNAEKLPEGVYYYRILANSQSERGSMIIIR